MGRFVFFEPYRFVQNMYSIYTPKDSKSFVKKILQLFLEMARCRLIQEKIDQKSH